MFDLKSTYFNTAYFGPMPLKAKARVEAAIARTLDPSFMSFNEWFDLSDRVRSRFAALLGCPADNVALSTSVAELVSHIANGLELQDGDEILLLKGDYPSMVLPWMVRAERTPLNIRLLDEEVFADPSRLSAEIGPRTRAVGVSHVTFHSGRRYPINEIGRLCRERGVLFIADASQSFGAMSVNLANVDILVGVAYKWLLGPYGSAYGYFSDDALAHLHRTHANWLVSPNSLSVESLVDYTTAVLPGARKFDRGQSPSFLITAALEGALEVIQEKGLKRIEAHNLSLARHFATNIPRGYNLVINSDEVTPILCIRPQREDAMDIRAKLATKGMDMSVREGRLRLSFHFFNTLDEINKLLQAL